MASTLSSLTGLRGGNLTVSGYGGVLKLGVKLSRPARSGSSHGKSCFLVYVSYACCDPVVFVC